MEKNEKVEQFKKNREKCETIDKIWKKKRSNFAKFLRLEKTARFNNTYTAMHQKTQTNYNLPHFFHELIQSEIEMINCERLKNLCP